MSMRPLLLVGAGVGECLAVQSDSTADSHRTSLQGIHTAYMAAGDTLLVSTQHRRCTCCSSLHAGICYVAGVPVIDWVLSLFQILFHVVSALLWAFWQLLQPAQDQRHSSLPELHQVCLCVCVGMQCGGVHVGSGHGEEN
jgi:hypothetical protein